MKYPDHETLVAPARGPRAGFGWTALGCGVILMVVILLTQLTYDIGIALLQQNEDIATTSKRLMSGTTPGAMLVLLFGFAGWLVAIGLTLQIVHNRSLTSALGTRAIQQFRNVFSTLVILNLALFLLPPWSFSQSTLPGLPFAHWAMLLPLSLLAVLIQVSAEEVLFRGYLQQQLAARVASPLVWMGVPTVIFALAHYDPMLGRNAWPVVVWAAIYGLLMADLTARAGSLGPAIAVHFVNNTTAMLLVAPPDMLSGLALRQFPFPITDETAVSQMLFVDLALMIVSWLAARLALRR